MGVFRIGHEELAVSSFGDCTLGTAYVEVVSVKNSRSLRCRGLGHLGGDLTREKNVSVPGEAWW